MFSGSSTFVSEVDQAFLFILIISVIFFVGIVFTMIYFVVRYHHKKNQTVSQSSGNLTLELLWTVIPTILVLAMFYYGFIGYRNMKTIPPDALEIQAMGRMWSWLYTYENGYQTDTLTVPLGKPVKILVESSDVLHSFYIPAFRIKQDAVPGMKNYVWFEATETGVFDIFCAEYCGDRHSYMLSLVKVVPQEEYASWYDGTVQFAPAAGGSMAGGAERKPGSRGPMLVKIKGCVACHSVDGSPLVGPTFKGVFGHNVTVITGGKEREILADEEYLRRSILEPQADRVKGFENIPMPPQGLTDEELAEIIAYLKELK